jgi:hypothetical protein
MMCGDMHEILDRRHREHQQHHGPRTPTTPRPQALAPPRQRQDPDGILYCMKPAAEAAEEGFAWFWLQGQQDIFGRRRAAPTK